MNLGLFENEEDDIVRLTGLCGWVNFGKCAIFIDQVGDITRVELHARTAETVVGLRSCSIDETTLIKHGAQNPDLQDQT